MSEPTLDDLRVWQVNSANAAGGSGWWRELTPAEFDRIATERDYVNFSDLPEELERRGWVRRPVCGECDKGRKATWSGDRIVCPSCGGTGFGRLVALDGIDVEALRAEVNGRQSTFDTYDHAPFDHIHPMDAIYLTAKAVLAAIDQEAT